jgi:hypothetical protein
VLGGDTEDGRQKGYGGFGVETAIGELCPEQTQSLRLFGDARDPASVLQKTPHRMKTGIGMEHRSEQSHDGCARVDREKPCGGGQPTLAHARLTTERDARGLQCAGLGPGPAGIKVGHLLFAGDEWSERNSRWTDAFADHLVVLDGPLDALDRLRRPVDEVEVVTHKPLDRGGHNDRPRRRESRHPRRQIGAEAVHVVAFGVEIHRAAMHADSD